MALKKPTIVLFDMDGTTVRHLNPWLLSVLEKLDDTAHKIAAFVSRLCRRKIESPSLVAFDKEGKRRKLPVHRALHKMRRKPVEQIVEPCPGIYELLRFLRDNDIPMGIISNGLGKGYGHDILETFDLDEFYQVKLFREDLRRTKPYPDPILQAIEAMGVTPDEDDVIWYIGDRGKDITAAMAAKDYLPCTVQPIGYNLNTAVAVLLENNLGPEHIYMGWIDLEAKLRRLFTGTGNGKTGLRPIGR